MASLSISSSRVRIGMRVACSACLAHARRRGSGACGGASCFDPIVSVHTHCNACGPGPAAGRDGRGAAAAAEPWVRVSVGFRPGRGRFGGRYVKLGSHSARSDEPWSRRNLRLRGPSTGGVLAHISVAAAQHDAHTLRTPQAREPLSLWTEVWLTQPVLTQPELVLTPAVNRRSLG
jgi:hypothetical protein